MHTPQYWIDHLDLMPHPEGGYYAETYRAKANDGVRAASTGIYFLLAGGDVSHFHSIDADEMWHFYAGHPLRVHMIDAAGVYTHFDLGNDPAAGQVFQAVVPAAVWFGASLLVKSTYALVGCTVAPGFEFEHFQLATRAGLLADYPDHADIISELTPDN